MGKRKHPWNISPGDACAVQNSLKHKIITEDTFKQTRYIGGADVAYDISGNRASCVVAVLSFPDLEMQTSSSFTGNVGFAYIPGLLAFREGPLIEKAFSRLKITPDILMIDGHGICHPGGIGIATHMGIYLDIPTIGCAKNHLFGYYTDPDLLRGSRAYISSGREIIGCVLRTKDSIKPVFISAGHRISLETSVEICLRCSRGYRIPEPLRMAHILARQII